MGQANDMVESSTESATVTDGARENHIEVNVSTHYIEEQSQPEEGRYVFSYTITLHNTGGQPARLMTRHWIINDANGNTQEVHGEGVVGEHPYLRPGESFKYTSGTVLETPVGCMEGSYQMVSEDGKPFDADIPAFTLSQPHALH